MATEREMVLNMGPQHPSTHGVLRVMLKLDGEVIVEAQPDIGYLHRCFEKLAEDWSYPQVVPLTDRNDYLAAMTNELVYVMAVEKLLGIEVPERAKYIRVIMAELQRICSHLLWWATFALDLGALTPFFYGFREREMTYDLFEMVTGGRLLYSYMRIGGVRNDLPDRFTQKTLEFLDWLEKMLWEYDRLLTRNRIFEHRTIGVAPLSAADAIAYGASGPVLRGSGVPRDLRKVEPYLVYDRFDFEIPVGRNGDCYDRYIVRMKEIEESAKIIRQALESIPDGEVLAKVPRQLKPPAGEVYVRIESPRGEVGAYLISDGSQKPYRLKWRAPSFAHLELIPLLGPGLLIADMVVLIGSIDIILGEVDR